MILPLGFFTIGKYGAVREGSGFIGAYLIGMWQDVERNQLFCGPRFVSRQQSKRNSRTFYAFICLPIAKALQKEKKRPIVGAKWEQGPLALTFAESALSVSIFLPSEVTAGGHHDKQNAQSDIPDVLLIYLN